MTKMTGEEWVQRYFKVLDKLLKVSETKYGKGDEGTKMLKKDIDLFKQAAKKSIED